MLLKYTVHSLSGFSQKKQGWNGGCGCRNFLGKRSGETLIGTEEYYNFEREDKSLSNTVYIQLVTAGLIRGLYYLTIWKHDLREIMNLNQLLNSRIIWNVFAGFAKYIWEVMDFYDGIGLLPVLPNVVSVLDYSLPRILNISCILVVKIHS